MPDVFWNGLFAAIVTIVLAWMQHRTKQSVEVTGTAAVVATKSVAAQTQAVAVAVDDATIANSVVTKAVTEAVKNTAAQAAVHVEQVAAAAIEVKDVLATVNEAAAHQLESLKAVADSTHILVNSNFGKQLKISMLALKRIADLTKNVEDVAAAEHAESEYAQHMASQKIVDQQKITKWQ